VGFAKYQWQISTRRHIPYPRRNCKRERKQGTRFGDSRRQVIWVIISQTGTVYIRSKQFEEV